MYADESENAALKISDFGLSKMLYGEQGNTSTVCGTPGYCGKVRTACFYFSLIFLKELTANNLFGSRVVGSIHLEPLVVYIC